MIQPDNVRDLDAEIELLRRIGSGDQVAFADLYDRFHGVLFATSYRMLNNQEAVEDVIQDVFVQIWEKAGLYDATRGKPLTWAITLTRNKTIDRIRSLQRRGRLQGDLESEAKSDLQFDDRDAAVDVDFSEKSAILRQCIAKLSKEQREAIELAFFSGLTQTEISERIGEPLGTVKARIRRGMMKLRDGLDGRL